jgi:RNA 2',3'-cyclic 3'-phosphodiesterase
MAKIRTFIALELPPELKLALASLQGNLRSRTDCVRWVKPEHIHLTLKFLGPTEEGLVEPVGRILANLAQDVSPFRTQIAGLGAFPNSRNPKVIWVGMPGEQAILIEFQQQLEDALAPVGFAKEKRSFAPHLTLGRVKEGKGKKELEQLITEYQNKDLGNFAADTLILFRSDLHPSGPVYSALKTIKL